MRSLKQHPYGLILALLAAFLLPSLACSIGGLTIDKDSATVDITLKQDQVNTLLKNNEPVTSNDPDRLLDKITSVEMHDGYMRIFGTGEAPDGSPVEGSFDVSLGVENDVLQVEVIAVDVPGVTMDDPRIQNANKELTESLTKSVTESNGEVQYKEAKVTEGALQLKVQVNYNQNK